MLRLFTLAILSFVLSSCIILQTDEESGRVVTGGGNVVPNSGSYTYVCRGGRLSVTYQGNQVQIFYDGANRFLTLNRSAPRYYYTDGIYGWEISGRQATLFVRGAAVDSCSY